MARLRSKIEKTITLILSIFENAFNSGIFYGWPSLVFILKQQGYFREGCDTSPPLPGEIFLNTSLYPTPLPPYTQYVTVTDGLSRSPSLYNNLANSTGQVHEADNMLPCDSQDAKFQLVFTVAAFCIQGTVFPSGLLFDKLGTRFVRILFRYSNHFSRFC